MAPHVVYLANTSGLKVGITRGTQTPTRWMDQGATQALPIYQVSTRLISGLIETTLADHIADKTNWRALLKGNNEPLDLPASRDKLKLQISDQVQQIQQQWPAEIIDELEDSRRGIYGGIICAIDSQANLESCIAIRTAFIKDGVASVRAGAGIVFDSDPQAEADETYHKAKAILEGILFAKGVSA